MKLPVTCLCVSHSSSCRRGLWESKIGIPSPFLHFPCFELDRVARKTSLLSWRQGWKGEKRKSNLESISRAVPIPRTRPPPSLPLRSARALVHSRSPSPKGITPPSLSPSVSRVATAVRVASRQSVGGVKIKQEESAKLQGANQESTFVGEDHKPSLNRSMYCSTPDLMLDLAKPVLESIFVEIALLTFCLPASER